MPCEEEKQPVKRGESSRDIGQKEIPLQQIELVPQEKHDEITFADPHSPPKFILQSLSRRRYPHSIWNNQQLRGAARKARSYSLRRRDNTSGAKPVKPVQEPPEEISDYQLSYVPDDRIPHEPRGKTECDRLPCVDMDQCRPDSVQQQRGTDSIDREVRYESRHVEQPAEIPAGREEIEIVKPGI